MRDAEEAAIAVLETLPNLQTGWSVRVLPQWYLCCRCFRMIVPNERHLWHSETWLAFHANCAIRLGFERGALSADDFDTTAGDHEQD